MFNRRLVIVVLVVLVLLVGSTFVQAADKTLKLGHVGSTEDSRQDAAILFALLVEMKTHGQVKVDIYPAGMLGSWAEMIEGLEFGSIDIVIEALGTMERYTDSAAIGILPFIYRDVGHFLKVWRSSIGQEILDRLTQETGYLFLGSMYRGARNLTTVRPIESIDDLRGLKIRVPSAETHIQTWKNLGASPTPMAWTEVFTSLQQGVIEGQENPLDVIRFNSIHEVAPYLTLTGHIVNNYHFILWNETFKQYSDNLQKAIKEAAMEVSYWFSLNTLLKEEDNLSFLKENGAIVFEPEMDEWRDRVKDVIDSKSDTVKKWVQQIYEVQ